VITLGWVAFVPAAVGWMFAVQWIVYGRIGF